MKHLKVVLYDEEAKSIIESDSIPDGELEFSGGNDAIFIETFLKVNELAVGSERYEVVTRRFIVDSAKLVIGVKQKR